MKKLVFFLLVFSSIQLLSQRYEVFWASEDYIFTCADPGELEYAYVPVLLLVSYTDNIPTGIFYYVEDILSPSASSIAGPINIPTESLFCGRPLEKPEDMSSLCSDRTLYAVAIRPSNFDIITPEPGKDNTREIITLEATPGFHPLVYNWQYFDPFYKVWIPFPKEFLGKSSISFSASDLATSTNSFNPDFGPDLPNSITVEPKKASDYMGISIQYKLELCNGWSPKDPYTYVFIDSSPKLIEGGFKPTDTSCSYTSDGGFAMILDRDLNDRRLVVSLYKRDENGDMSFLRQESTTELLAIENKEDKYIWPVSLAPGEYQVKYQTVEKGVTASEDPKNNFWTSLEFSKPFTVGSPEAIKFSGNKNDLTCFNNGTGEISLQIDKGAEGRTYSFKITKEGTTIKNWTPFTNDKNHIIKDLSAGTYKIKVKDSNGCFAIE